MAEHQKHLPEKAPLQLRGITFGYEPGHLILKGVDLCVEPGSCVCLMGVNGCGKSTLIDCVLGENTPASGEILLAGQPAQQMKPAQRARLVSYVPQSHERTFPYPAEHVVLMGRTAYAGALGAPATAADKQLVQETLQTCGIAHLAQRPYTELSGGEMQMVLLARALVQQARLVVMDEPTAHLDFHNELLFLEMVERLVLQKNATVLMATHSPNQAFHLASAGVPVQVALMHQGTLWRTGAPAQVLDQTALRDVFGVTGVVVTDPVSHIVALSTHHLPGQGRDF